MVVGTYYSTWEPLNTLIFTCLNKLLGHGRFYNILNLLMSAECCPHLHNNMEYMYKFVMQHRPSRLVSLICTNFNCLPTTKVTSGGEDLLVYLSFDLLKIAACIFRYLGTKQITCTEPRVQILLYKYVYMILRLQLGSTLTV